MLASDKCRPTSFYRIALLSLSLGLTSFSLNVNAASLTLVTKDGAGNPGNAVSSNPSISNNGRYVLYHSEAGNLVDGDTNNATDVFLYDRQTRVTYRITQGNDDSVDARISNNLKYVVFSSFASNLVDEPGNLFSDIFLYETKTGAIKKISVDRLGTHGNSGSFTPSISSNGRYVVYESNANNLVPGDSNNNRDIFLYDKKTAITALVSADSSGAPGNNTSNFARISGNGQYVVYQSDATNLVGGDGNGASDIFLFDKKQKTTYLISSSINGQGNGNSITPFISNNGRYIVYASYASNLVNGDGNGTSDIFLYDTNTGVTRMVSVNNTTGQQGNGESLSPRISGNGRYIVYSSAASNLVEGDTNNLPDIFRYDTKTGVTTRVSVRVDGAQGSGGGSFSPGISNNGRYTVYESFADNLADGDTNATSDIFLHDNK